MNPESAGKATIVLVTPESLRSHRFSFIMSVCGVIDYKTTVSMVIPAGKLTATLFCTQQAGAGGACHTRWWNLEKPEAKRRQFLTEASRCERSEIREGLP